MRLSDIPLEERGAVELSKLRMSSRLQRLLVEKLGMRTLGQACEITTQGVYRIRGVGPGLYAELARFLDTCGVPHKLDSYLDIVPEGEAERLIRQAERFEGAAKTLRELAASLLKD